MNILILGLMKNKKTLNGKQLRQYYINLLQSMKFNSKL